jgi:hypothetical protein
MEEASSSSISQQGASNSSKPTYGRDLKLVASQVGMLHLEKTKVSESTTRKPKARVRHGGTRGIQQPGRVITSMPKEPHISYVRMSVRIQRN